MAKYLVERHLPGITSEQLLAAAGAARSTALRINGEGVPVRYLRSTFIPEEERCFCLFEGDSAEVVEKVQVAASLPFERIVPALHLAAEDLD